MNFLEKCFVGQNHIERFARFTALTIEKIYTQKMQILQAVLETILDGGKPSEHVQGGYVRS